jgi:hypothetical protein
MSLMSTPSGIAIIPATHAEADGLVKHQLGGWHYIDIHKRAYGAIPLMRIITDVNLSPIIMVAFHSAKLSGSVLVKSPPNCTHQGGGECTNHRLADMRELEGAPQR